MKRLLELLDTIDSNIDFFYGALFGAIPLFFGAGWFILITVPACAVLYAMGGDNDWHTSWRDVGCSAVNALCLILATGNLLFLGAGLATFGLLTIGLGLPSTQPPDAGSIVGRWFWKLSGGQEWLANIYTHAFVYFDVWCVYFVASLLRGILW